MSNTTDRPQCAVHEQRLNAMEEAMGELAKAVASLKQMADRALGGAAVLMLIQPVITGLVLYYLTRAH